MRRALTGAVGTALALTGCAAPYDGDGEGRVVFSAVRPTSAGATPVVVDTDLGGDDLAALTFLLRHPDVDVEAITVAGGGLVGCDRGVDLVADLLTLLEEEPVPIACTAPASGGLPLPAEWRELAARGTGITRSPVSMVAEPGPASALIARLARRDHDLVLVALGPMTTAAELAETSPGAFARLAGIHAMGGSVAGEPVDGVAEWNAAADLRGSTRSSPPASP